MLNVPNNRSLAWKNQLQPQPQRFGKYGSIVVASNVIDYRPCPHSSNEFGAHHPWFMCPSMNSTSHPHAFCIYMTFFINRSYGVPVESFIHFVIWIGWIDYLFNYWWSLAQIICYFSHVFSFKFIDIFLLNSLVNFHQSICLVQLFDRINGASGIVELWACMSWCLCFEDKERPS